MPIPEPHPPIEVQRLPPPPAPSLPPYPPLPPPDPASPPPHPPSTQVQRRIESDSRHTPALLRALIAHCPASDRCHTPLLIRLCFVLANLTAASPPSRAAVAAAAPHLLRLLAFHTAALVDAVAAAAVQAEARGEGSGGEEVLEPILAPDVSKGDLAASNPEHVRPADASNPERGRRANAAGTARSAVADKLGRRSLGGGGGTTDSAGGGGVGGGVAVVADVLVKLIRLIAHLAMGPAEGAAIAAAPESASLLRLLSALPLEPTLVGDAPPLCIEELQLNALSAVTNLTFYTAGVGSALLGAPGATGSLPQGTSGGGAGVGCAGGGAAIGDVWSCHQRALCGLLAQALTHPNAEAAAEAARALGNISRLPPARLTLCELLADEALLILLEHPSAQVGRGGESVCALGDGNGSWETMCACARSGE